MGLTVESHHEDRRRQHYEDGLPESPRDREGPYEHPALEPEPGYWAGRWAETKRLAALSWNRNGTKEGVILSSIVFFGMTLWGIAMRVWEVLFG